jgi:ATP-dependent DNA helicase RecG
MYDLRASLSEVPGIPPRFVPKLKQLGIETVRDLLFHFPARYEDFSTISTVADLIPNQEATVTARVVKIGSRRTWRRSLYLIEAVLEDETGEVRATWFNQPYIRNVLAPGRLANFSGKVSLSRTSGEVYLSNPTYELLSEHREHEETRHTARIVPVYPETRGLTSKGLRYLIQPLLRSLPPVTEVLPEEILHAKQLPGIGEALRTVHFPDTIEEALAAKRRFAFEDLFFLQLSNTLERLRRTRERARTVPENITGMKELIGGLPFELMQSQKSALWEVLQDMARPHPMNRLLQGDVGSGKTIVAALAALHAAQAKCQAAFMAPTEILARQHFATLTRTFHSFGGGVALLTGSESRAWYGHGLETTVPKATLKRDVAAGKVAIVVGTHALIERTVAFDRLALVVVDEQHRFGVEQRARLARSASGQAALAKKGAFIPHFLSMSATPIPRTLSLTLFSNLDLSLITELPKNRKPIETRAVPPDERAAAYRFIRNEIRSGRQAFVICPRIELPDPATETLSAFAQLEVKSVKEEYEKLRTKVFPDLRVGMLHGKMRPTEKEKVMREFSERAVDVLVATSVIEVGVDIPNATIMMVEGAERFGLAQLYQFRGRVGRGEHQSYCFLFTDSSAQATRARIAAVVKARNGFELAEHDLKLRGPGEFLGKSQTGMPDLAMKALQNPDLVKSAREAALAVITEDPSLKGHPVLRERLTAFAGRVHWE